MVVALWGFSVMTFVALWCLLVYYGWWIITFVAILSLSPTIVYRGWSQSWHERDWSSYMEEMLDNAIGLNEVLALLKLKKQMVKICRVPSSTAGKDWKKLAWLKLLIILFLSLRDSVSRLLTPLFYTILTHLDLLIHMKCNFYFAEIRMYKK